MLNRMKFLRWLVTGLALAIICGAVSSHLPQQLRMLWLAPLAIGLVLGWLLKLSSRDSQVTGRSAYVTAMLLGCISYGLTSYLWWQDHVVSVKSSFKRPSEYSYLHAAIHTVSDPKDRDRVHQEARALSREGNRQDKTELRLILLCATRGKGEIWAMRDSKKVHKHRRNRHFPRPVGHKVGQFVPTRF